MFLAKLRVAAGSMRTLVRGEPAVGADAYDIRFAAETPEDLIRMLRSLRSELNALILNVEDTYLPKQLSMLGPEGE